MNNKNKTFKINGRKKPAKRISDIFNALKPTIPRKIKFSGHFSLNTPHFNQNLLEIPSLTN